MMFLTFGDLALLALSAAAAVWPIFLTWVLAERVGRDRQARLKDFVDAFAEIIEEFRKKRDEPDRRA